MSRRIATFLAASLTLLAAFVGMAQAQDGYKLRSGDTVRIEVLEDPSLNRSLLVAPDGRISMPFAGGIRASGRTLETIQSEVVSKLAPNFATSPTVYLALERQEQARPSSNAQSKAPVIAIFIMGEANKPGKLEVSPGTTALQAFAQMGGFGKFAATKRIQLRRGDKTYSMNYNDIEAGKSNAGDTVLAEGDVILVPQRKLFE